jgi:hypothetical protein
MPALLSGWVTHPDTVDTVTTWMVGAGLTCIMIMNIGFCVLMAAGLRFLILLVFGKRDSNQDITLPPARI